MGSWLSTNFLIFNCKPFKILLNNNVCNVIIEPKLDGMDRVLDLTQKKATS